ncbi:hypothetical protein HYALB_00009027 [Hymenoscyphus albidus]|uniref:Uncharacterized protein n=1 Tax=Hymenoscyphus albidus TaxID=595503 RepID=A0A9N9LIR5_9HELO|nr:hypothetical protein HYALB_00009027 [Hymenoscyphus albidus]
MLTLNVISTFLSLAAVSTAMIVPETLHPRKQGGANKPAQVAAVTQVTVYSGPYTCPNSQYPPPAGYGGTTTVVNVAQNTCTVVNMPAAGAISAVLTTAPPAGNVGCYLQIFSINNGCTFSPQNEYHGFPFDGVAVGNKVGCVSPPVYNYAAVSLLCD